MKKLISIKVYLIVFMITFLGTLDVLSQERMPEDVAAFKQKVLELETKHEKIDLAVKKSSKTLKTGILVATLGYAVTIAGGQLLGTNPQAGEVLLYTGGAIGLGGTIILFRGFNQLSGP